MHYILIISPEPWDGHFVSKHHYAITLASQGSHVYFLGPPQKSTSNCEIKKTQYKNLFEIRASKLAIGLRFYPDFLKRKIEKKWLKNLESLIENRFTTIWLFENSRFYDMTFAQKRLKIYHQVDSNQDFHMDKAASTADICFCTTDFIKQKLKLYNNNVYKIHHGVSSISSGKILNSQQKKLFFKNKINVVLIGNLDIKYLDTSILEKLIKQFPSIGIHLVGDFSKEGICYQLCHQFENVTFWGKVDAEIIPDILDQCDVSLLLYKAHNTFDIEQLASPHKVMEYLSSGKVTVASYTDEYKDKRYLLEMVDDNNQYISKFDEVIQNLSDYNSPERQLQRKQFAQENTYDKQLNKIGAYLRKHNLTQ